MPCQTFAFRFPIGFLWPGLALLGLTGALAGCGSEEPPQPRQMPRNEYQGSPYQAASGYQQPYQGAAGYQQAYAPPAMPQQQWGVPSQRPPMAMQPWQQAPGPAMQGQAPTMSSPAAENPWQKPPVGFGGAMQAPQMMWQQPQPVMPQFRPLEPEKGKEYRSQQMPAVAPYDRPMGSSQDMQQQGWPGYYPGGAGYPGYQGYPGYPGMQPGYWGATPAPWGMPGTGPVW